MKSLTSLLFFCCCFQAAFSVLVSRDIFINADSLTTVDGSKFPYLAFNESPAFNQRNVVLSIDLGDSLELTIINNHTKAHQFKLMHHPAPAVQVLPGDTIVVLLGFATAGVFICHDPLDFPANTYLGLAGMIVVKDHGHTSFYWNLREHQYAYNFDLSNGNSVDWDLYNPQYFTVNSLSNPQINTDPTSRITAKVGDTVIIYMANTGQSIHSIHIHGFHAEIVTSSMGNKYKGRIKDTLPLHSMSTLILRLVPDKAGEYPLHNHNLVAVSGNNVYPNGMFSTMLISP